MKDLFKDTANFVTKGSDENSLTFPEVIKAIASAGIERYYADLVCSKKTYYQTDNTFVEVACHTVSLPAKDFSEKDIKAAIKAIQSKEITYQEFCHRITAAGCVGYHVTVIGRRAIYYGRTGDSYTEWFPDQ